MSLTDQERDQLATAWSVICESGEKMAAQIERDALGTCNAEFDLLHRVRHSLRDMYKIVKRSHDIGGE